MLLRECDAASDKEAVACGAGDLGRRSDAGALDRYVILLQRLVDGAVDALADLLVIAVQ